MIVNSRAISLSEMAAVGSSMMMMSDSVATAFAISTICFLATLRLDTSWRGLMEGSRLFMTLTIELILSVFRRKPNLVSSMPSVRFSSTVSWSTTFNSWKRVLIPFCFASRVLCGVYSSPFRRIRPPDRGVAPVRILIRVDFPAPFSPTRQCTVFLLMSKLTLLTALTAGKSFTRSLISRTLSVRFIPLLPQRMAGGGAEPPPAVRCASTPPSGSVYRPLVPNCLFSHSTALSRDMVQ